MSNLVRRMPAGAVDLGGSNKAASVGYPVGAIHFGPAHSSLWEEQPSLRELYDQACAGLVRAECEAEELRAEAAMLQEQARILARERDEAREDFDEEMKFHHRTHGECVMAQCELMDVKNERDEAREALREIASLQRYDHKFWDDGDGQIDESEREKADGMYLLHAQVFKILTRVLK